VLHNYRTNIYILQLKLIKHIKKPKPPLLLGKQLRLLFLLSF